jgi:tetratricopeptide (TPR) repeat protein
MGEEYLLAVLHAAGSATPAEVERAQNATDRRFRRPVTVLLWSFVLGPFQPARLVTDVLAANQRSGDAWTRAAVQLCKVYPGLTDADPAGSERALRNALGRFRLIGDRWGSALALDALADLAAGSGRPEPAAELLGEALEIADELGTDEQAALLLCRRGDLRLRIGDHKAASADYYMALELGEKTGLPDTSAAARIGLARTSRYAGDLAGAREFALAAVPDGDADWAGADLARDEALAELRAVSAATSGCPRRISGGWLESG